MWCVIECSSKGEIYEPEFFNTKKEAIKYIMNDSGECYAMYSDFNNTQIRYDSSELTARVWTNEFSFKWQVFDVSDKLM